MQLCIQKLKGKKSFILASNHIYICNFFILSIKIYLLFVSTYKFLNTSNFSKFLFLQQNKNIPSSP